MERIKQIIKNILLFILFLYEELFIIPAKKILNYFRRISLYDKIIKLVSYNLITLIFFLFFLGFIAETSAMIGGFFLVKKHFILGISFYMIKIILLVPIVDVFKYNKKRLLKIKLIRILYFYYIKFENLKFFRKLRKIKKNLVDKIKKVYYNFKDKIKKYFKPGWRKW